MFPRAWTFPESQLHRLNHPMVVVPETGSVGWIISFVTTLALFIK